MLALDPYYEMFPSSYQRPYPSWRYSWGGGLGAIPSCASATAADSTCKDVATGINVCNSPTFRLDVATNRCAPAPAPVTPTVTTTTTEPRFSKGAKVAVGVGIGVVVLGIGAALFARR